MARREWASGSLCRRTVTRKGKTYRYWRGILPASVDPRRPEFQSRDRRKVEAWLDRGFSLERERVTVGAYAIDWLQDTARTVKPSTAEFYRHQLRHLEPIADMPLDALTPAHVRALIAASAEHHATRTTRGIVQTLAQMLKRAQEDGHVERNVAALVRLPKLDTKPARHFTAAEARRFLHVASDDDLGSLYAVALGTGLRRGELLALSWADVDLAANTVRIRRSKTSAGVRLVPLAGFARMALADLPKRPGPIWPYRPEYVTRHFQELCRQAGVPVIRFHDLRHTAATLMAEAGVPEETRKWILGHTNVAMTRHYSHESERLMREAVEALGREIA